MTISQGPAIVAEAQDSNTPQVYAKASIIVSESEVVATPTPSPGPDRYLVVSPYTEQQHLLDLDTLDTENQLLALALTHMRCLRDDYATAPYLDTFNWPDIIDTLRALANQRQHAWRKTSFYIVAFRSRIPPTTIYAELGTLDKAAHVEATSSGGFLK
ncbi:hypothetical protein QC763_301880 [Podospora pseudopauciseta]|uniref:Uncharacterized protein n=1 Tax=Podospora pseudopauciseta TaxID=2093780 RepID=A0ABR0HFH5_9PEZI|nr:hypothetical protein QC763_301880 [Podospora pseudopauciseta]